ncbi:hypothetical protein D1007_22131 [Hordeum vulgare]|nr:hypothetical protein D1007_22131 [Hordeum vulgare]
MSLSRAKNIKATLTNAQKGSQSASAYLGQMRALSDELAAVGQAISERKLLSFNIADLDMEYQPIISALDARTDPFSADTLFSMVSNFNQHVDMFHGTDAGSFKSSANAAYCSCQGPPRTTAASKVVVDPVAMVAHLVAAAVATMVVVVVATTATVTTRAAPVAAI